MFKASEFCIPIKHDGYRLRVERDSDRVRLITRGGYDWTKRYPWIAEAARKVRQKRFVLDGEAVILGVDGVSDFDALHSGKHDDEVQLCAFDILAEGGDDLRKLLLHLRKTSLERLLARRPEGIFVNPFERGEIGPDLFRAACEMGLEGLVSKHRDRPYQLRQVEALEKASGDEPGDGGVWMTSNFLSNLLTAVGVGAGVVFQRICLRQGHHALARRALQPKQGRSAERMGST
jgi:ATP-dependent DNA ligase